jgi:prevent-host-death family protein
MKTPNAVNVAALKSRLSHYLKRVEKGEELVVTAHKRQVARILPVRETPLPVYGPVRPVSDLRKLKGVKRKRVSAVRALIEDRSIR